MFDETPRPGSAPIPGSGSQSRSDTPTSSIPPAARQVHTMPGKFIASSGPTSSGKKSNRRWFIIIIALSVVLLAGGVLAFLRFRVASEPNVNATTNTNANTNLSNGNTNVNVNTNGNSNLNANTNSAAPTILKVSLTDPETNEKISTATVTLPSGALPASVTSPVAITALSAHVGAYATSEQYQAIGGVFLLTPSGTRLTNDASIEITYTDTELLSLGFVVDEKTLSIAVWEGTEWRPLNTLVDTKTNTATSEFDEFFTDGIAIVIAKPASTNTNTATNTNTNTGGVIPSLDSDTDGLTNQEEILYGTNAGGADTDLDGFKDGQEVLALYNPNGTGRLADSSLVKLYENTTYKYSMFYPPSWTVGTLNADKLVMFTSITGEFVQASIQDNPSKKSAREWYLALNPSVDQTKLRDIAVGSLTGILGPDGLNVYLADATSIYQITYNIGTKTEANYLTTFTMMYSSFLTGVSGGNSNTNTPTNTNTNSASNTNGA